MTELIELERLGRNVADAKAAYDAADAYDVSYASYVAWKTAYTRWAETRLALSNYLKEQHK